MKPKTMNPKISDEKLKKNSAEMIDNPIETEIADLIRAAAISPEMVTISKDEYIALLQNKIARIEGEQKQGFVPRTEPHSWMNGAEIAEILRLNKEGVRPGEIAKRVRRPFSTVRRCIQRHEHTSVDA